MTRERAKSMDRASLLTEGTAEAPRKRRRTPTASPEPGGMIDYAPVLEFIWGMSDKRQERDASADREEKRDERYWSKFTGHYVAFSCKTIGNNSSAMLTRG